MKYGKITLGQIEAIINKLGGEKGVMQFLSNKAHVSITKISDKKFEKDIDDEFDRTNEGKGWKLRTDTGPFNEKKFIPKDRKSVVQGKSVDLGGRRIIKKKKKEEAEKKAKEDTQKSTTP